MLEGFLKWILGFYLRGWDLAAIASTVGSLDVQVIMWNRPSLSLVPFSGEEVWIEAFQVEKAEGSNGEPGERCHDDEDGRYCPSEIESTTSQQEDREHDRVGCGIGP